MALLCPHCDGEITVLSASTARCKECGAPLHRSQVEEYNEEGSGRQTRVGHWQRDDCDVYAGRGPGGRPMDRTEIGDHGWLGNPYTLDDADSRAASIEAFRADFVARIKTDEAFRDAVAELSGKTLGCWCQRLDEDGPPCHAEVIAEWADRIALSQGTDGDRDE